MTAAFIFSGVSMDVYNAICNRHTIRRFTEKEISESVLEKCINAARLSPTARNLQPLEFIAVQKPEDRAKVLELVTFGGIVKEKGIQKGEEPKAFIVVLLNKQRAEDYSGNDAGIAVQSIALTALEQRVGSCIMGSVQREKLRPLLGVPESFEIVLVIALGFPKENPQTEETDEKTNYWIDSENNLHVPKRPLEKVLHREKY